MPESQLDDAEVRALRDLLDRDAVARCVLGYFHALDARDYDVLDEVFAPEVDLADGAPPVPRDQLKAMLHGVEQFRVSHHLARSPRVVLDGDRAHADTYVIDALLIDDPDRRPPGGPWPVHDGYPDAVLRFHGLRYADELERLSEGWRIARRRGPLAFWRLHQAGVEVHPDFGTLRAH